MSDAVLSIGGNIGDRLAVLQQAAAAFEPWLTGASAVYETPPWGPVAQPAFYNAVLLVRDPLADGRVWLERSQRAERAAGRVRDVRWGPRTLDVDVVQVDGEISDDPTLTLPHPRAAKRAFVLVPWHAIDPGAILHGRRIDELIAELPPADVAGVRLTNSVLR